MQTPNAPDLTLPTLIEHFRTDEQAREYLEGVRWPLGVVCPHCQNRSTTGRRISRIAANPAKKIRAGLWFCGACRKQFTVTVGTVFEDSKIPLRKWLIAWYLLCSSKKGISSLQIQRVLALGSYRSALFMMHRIRHALTSEGFADKLGGVVEVDETYVGGKARNVGQGFKGNKTPVVSLVERQGRVRSFMIDRITSANLRAAIHGNVRPNSRILTDDRRQYVWATRGHSRHERVNHTAGEYARGDVHTNTVEGFFSLLKRGIVGVFHHVSRQHLPLYLAEFDHRYNCRRMTDGQRTVVGLAMAEGKRLVYWRAAPPETGQTPTQDPAGV